MTSPEHSSTASTKSDTAPVVPVCSTRINKRVGRKSILNQILSKCDRERLRHFCSANFNIDVDNGVNLINWLLIYKTSCIYNVSPLEGAVSLGDYSITKALLDEGVRLESVSTIPHPLCIALEKGYDLIVKLLVQAGADVNLPFGDLYPMSYVFKDTKCTPEVVKVIMDAGFPVDGIIDKRNKKRTLHEAVISDKLAIAEMLLSVSATTDVQDDRGLTPLHYAAQSNKIEFIELFIEHGAQIDVQCQNNYTPLMYAIAGSCYNAGKLLIQCGASVNLINLVNKEYPMSPLYLAALNCELRFVKELVNEENVSLTMPVTQRSALHAVAANELADKGPASIIAANCIVELLIKCGADVNGKDMDGCTPLHLALQYENLNIARILIANGSLLNTSCNDYTYDGSYTAFHLAAATVNQNLIQLCLEYGADVWSTDIDGLNPIHHLLLSYLEIMDPTSKHDKFINLLKLFWKYRFPYDKLLVNEHFTNFVPDEIKSALQKQTLLFDGVKTTQLYTVNTALAQGATALSCSTDIPFPLHFIATKSDHHILLYFLTLGSPANIFNKEGETPLHVAAKLGHIKNCRLLLEYGACYNSKTKKSFKTPLQLAEENNHAEVFSLLLSVHRGFYQLEHGCFHPPEIGKLRALLNSTDRSGDTLISKAINLERFDLAECFMQLSVKNRIWF